MRFALSAALALALTCASTTGRADAARDTGAGRPDAARDSGTAQAIVERSRKLFAEGIGLFKKGDYAGAYSVWLLAYKTRPHYSVAANLGNAELKLNLFRDAAEHLSYAVQNYPREYAQEKRTAEAQLAQAKSKIGTVVVAASKQDAAILLDGQVVGHAPLHTELYIEPGERKFQARLGELASEPVTVVVAPGSTTEVELTLADPPVRTAETPTPVAKSPLGDVAAASSVERPNPARAYVLVVGGALTLVSAGIGTGFLLKRQSATSNADAIQSRVSSCREQTTPECDALGQRRREADEAGKIAAVGLVSAGVLATMTLAGWALLPSSQTQSLTVAAQPADRGRGFTFQIQGVF